MKDEIRDSFDEALDKEIKRLNGKVMKSVCKLIGEDGNIFNLLGKASQTLRRAGMEDKSKEMIQRVYSSKSYDEALSIIMDYVEVK